jgi:hypothetical protein
VRPRLVHKPVDFLDDERYLARGLDEDDANAIQARLPHDAVALSSSGCYGICPIYSVELRRDGSALYRGERFVERIGTFRGTVSLRDYARICVFLERFAFDELAPRYDGITFADGTGVMWTDDNTITIRTVGSGGTEKRVADYGRVAPPEFQAVQLLIERTIEGIAWEPAEGG